MLWLITHLLWLALFVLMSTMWVGMVFGLMQRCCPGVTLLVDVVTSIVGVLMLGWLFLYAEGLIWN